MFVSSGQAYGFIACVAFGFAGGLVFSFIQPFKFFLTYKITSIIFDFIAFIVLAFLFCEFCFWFDFPSLRGYMFFGVFVGLYKNF